MYIYLHVCVDFARLLFFDYKCLQVFKWSAGHGYGKIGYFEYVGVACKLRYS